MHTLYQSLGKVSSSIHGLENASGQTVGFMVQELDKLHQYVDNIIQLNQEFERQAGKDMLSKVQKDVFAKIVFNSRIYEFVHHQLAEINQEYKQLASRLNHLGIMYKEIQLDLDLSLKNGLTDENTAKQFVARLSSCIAVTKKELEAFHDEYVALSTKALEFLDNVAQNHQEISDYAAQLQHEQKVPTKELHQVLDAINAYSERIEQLSGRLGKVQFKESRIKKVASELIMTLEALHTDLQRNGLSSSPSPTGHSHRRNS